MGCNKSKMLNRRLIIQRYHFFIRNGHRRRNKLKANDFDDELLSLILSMLTLREKLVVTRVCKRWQRIVKQLLQKSISLKLGEHSIKCKCQCIHWQSWEFDPNKSFERDDCGYIIYPANAFKSMLKLCPNVKCLNLSHVKLDDETLETIIDNCPQLECLHLYDIRCNEYNDENENGGNNSNDGNTKGETNDVNSGDVTVKIKSKQWEKFVMVFAPQLVNLSIGALTAMDHFDIILLFKYCTMLEELRINNEIDIVAYLAIIRRTVQRIFIDCEHGIGLECISLLSFRKYAEKVIELGRIDVPCDLIDSVLSTIGCNFSNLRKLMVRFRPYDVEITTPASVLFDQLEELSLQFMSGNADSLFQTIISLGWNSIKCLTIQYASLSIESVLQIGYILPQIEKLVLHAVEFRCDHLSKRYGHRLCVECGRMCWKTIAQLPNLRHLRLHRAIIDDEICSAILGMHKLRSLDLHYCSNVSKSIVDVCSNLAKHSCHGQWFRLSIVSRGMVTFDINNSDSESSKSHGSGKSVDNLPQNLKIDVRVAFKLL